MKPIFQQRVQLDDGSILELNYPGENRIIEPPTDTPEQEEHHTQECECDRSFSGEKLSAFYCCCKDPIFNLKREQPTQEIELLDITSSKARGKISVEPDIYLDMLVQDKLNEVIEAVNKLQESNK